MKVDVRSTTQLVFDDGSPVRAASAIAPFGTGWLIAQDDETIAAWWRGSSIVPVRIFPPVDGHDRFSEEDGTKDLKPDLEAGCALRVDDGDAALLLGSGSLPARMRAALVLPDEPHCRVETSDLSPLYQRIAEILELPDQDLNLEGACVVGETLRWFQRGHGASGVASSSVDVGLGDLVSAVRGTTAPGTVPVAGVRRYAFNASGDVSLAVTDAVVLPDGRLLVSLAAEDAPDAVADGDVVAAALAVIDDEDVVAITHLPEGGDGTVAKVEGLAVRESSSSGVGVVAVVDQDDPHAPSMALRLEVSP